MLKMCLWSRKRLRLTRFTAVDLMGHGCVANGIGRFDLCRALRVVTGAL